VSLNFEEIWLNINELKLEKFIKYLVNLDYFSLKLNDFILKRNKKQQ
jgi:hypothetical protein